tara:strand:+ start:6100 stop:6927 length:828 start_codon:yes stop_codon:yes gene_type:complete
MKLVPLVKALINWMRINSVALPISKLYTNRLIRQIRKRPLPKHVAMILDGNRRFALSRNYQDVTEGHKKGVSKVEEFIEWANELQIHTITLWALSTDNLKRSESELEKLLNVVESNVDKWLDQSKVPLLRRKVKIIGRTSHLNGSFLNKMSQIESLTESAGPWQLNVAMEYGGRDELLDAFIAILRDGHQHNLSLPELADNLSFADIQKHLYGPNDPEPDLIIRTGGDTRLSGFLLWQSVYSELYFCNVFWPAFQKRDFLTAIKSYQDRIRRYGT